ncbi:MAG: TRAP transporter small permease [Pseudomonadota bacterium]
MATKSGLPVAKTGGNPILQAINFLSTLAGFVAAGLIFVSVLITCQMIFVRYVLNQSTIWQTEAVTYMVLGATLIGLPYVQRLRGHVNVDLIPIALPGLARKALAVFTLVATIIMASIMLYYGYEFWHIAFERGWRSDTVWGVSLWIPYIAVPIGFTLFILQLSADLLAVILGIEEPFGLPPKGGE